MAAALSMTILVAEGCDDRVPDSGQSGRTDLSTAGADHIPTGFNSRVRLVHLLARIEELDHAIPSLAPTPSMSPVPSPEATPGLSEQPADATPAPVLLPVALTGVEEAICAAGWPDCAKALRVARCESGPDYLAPWNGYHVGTFQIAPVHAWRFTAHGWDYWNDGDSPGRNAVVAYEIYQEQGWAPWPVCGFR